MLILSDKALSSEKNDTKIIQFGSVVLILQTISWNTVIYKFC